MKLKIICGQLEITPGRPDVNYKKIIDAIEKARSLEADILLLPEMALPGYLIGDIWEQQTFLDDCAYYAEKIVAATENICVIFGSVATEPGKLNEDGRVRKYNAAFACQNGKLLGGYQGRSFFIKTSLPNYREFDDCRHFYSLQKLCAEEGASVSKALQPLEIVIRGTSLRIGVMLCEDGWTENYHLNVPQTWQPTEHSFYATFPAPPTRWVKTVSATAFSVRRHAPQAFRSSIATTSVSRITARISSPTTAALPPITVTAVW